MAEKSSSRKKKPAAEEAGDIVFDPRTHEIVPKHEKLSEKEKAEVLERFHATLKELPKISIRDAAIRGLSLKQGDVIKITRKSYTAGETVFYRGVIDE